MDFKSVGLLDMVATKAVVAKNQIKVDWTAQNKLPAHATWWMRSLKV